MRHTTRVALPALWLLLLSALDLAAQPLEARRERILAMDMKITDISPPRPLTVVAVPVPPAPQPVASIRVRLHLTNTGAGTATVVIADEGGTEIERVDTSRFVDGVYWSAQVPGGLARLRLVAAVPGVEVHADQFALPITDARPQAIVPPTDDSQPITHETVPARAKLWGPSIARLKFIAGGLGRVCTGFLLGRDLLLTNQHCISNGAEAATAVVEFGVDSAGAVPVSFRVTKVEAVNEPLDYSLLRLSGDASKFGRLFVGPAATFALPLVVVQHPQGLPKKVAFPPNCSVGSTSVAGVNDQLNDFGHSCDTLGGSSGSPVVEATDGTVVGLHHWRWPDGAKIPENQAVHIALITQDLAKLVEAQRLSKEILDEVTRPRPQP